MSEKLLGNTDSICPHCSKPLGKMPRRKKKCPHCGQFMYVRTRPDDGRRVLVTEEGTRQIEEPWMFELAMYSNDPVDPQQLEVHKASLARKFGHEPSDQDALWSLLNSQLLEHAKNANWGLYRNARLSMAELLTTEKKFRAALDTYLEISYLDANGPRNLGGASHPEVLREYPSFDREYAFQAPAIVNRIDLLAQRLNLSDLELSKAYLAVAERLQRNLKLPVAPEEGWKDLVSERGEPGE